MCLKMLPSSINLKSQYSKLFYWDCSSLGEHTAEDRGVGSSILPSPIEQRYKNTEGNYI